MKKADPNFKIPRGKIAIITSSKTFNDEITKSFEEEVLPKT